MTRTHVRSSGWWLAAALAVGAAGCGGDSMGPSVGGGGGGGGTGAVATTSVAVKGTLAFAPADIKVSPGATVTWTWDAGAGKHNVTFSDASITSSSDITNGVYSTAMPTTPGTYSYRCTIHSGMTGTVVVQ